MPALRLRYAIGPAEARAGVERVIDTLAANHLVDLDRLNALESEERGRLLDACAMLILLAGGRWKSPAHEDQDGADVAPSVIPSAIR